MLCIYAHRLNASVNWWELFSLKAFDKNQDVDSRSRKKTPSTSHLIVCESNTRPINSEFDSMTRVSFLETVLFKYKMKDKIQD